MNPEKKKLTKPALIALGALIVVWAAILYQLFS